VRPRHDCQDRRPHRDRECATVPEPTQARLMDPPPCSTRARPYSLPCPGRTRSPRVLPQSRPSTRTRPNPRPEGGQADILTSNRMASLPTQPIQSPVGFFRNRETEPAGAPRSHSEPAQPVQNPIGFDWSGGLIHPYNSFKCYIYPMASIGNDERVTRDTIESTQLLYMPISFD
jgi:hypothetical protein